MAITTSGIYGEQLVHELLGNDPYIKHFGGDWIMKSLNGKWYVLEVKYHELFKKGWDGKQEVPWDGNGTEIWKIKMRLEFQEETGIRQVLIWVDKKTNKMSWNFLDELEKGEHIDTEKGLRIYPIANYKNIISLKRI